MTAPRRGPYRRGVVPDLNFLSAYLSVDRGDLDVMAGWLRADGCPEGEVTGHVHDMLNAGSERTVPEWYTGAEVPNDDERFTVRKQPSGWSRKD